MTTNEDREALAAEYALGTLDADERARVELMLETDPPFATLVHAWEKKLGELHHTIAPVEPPAHVWQRIVSRLDGTPAQGGGADVIDLTKRLRRWRGAAVLSGALAASLMLFVALKETAPHLLPAPLRPAERFVAVLQEGNGSPGFVMTVDLKSKSFSVRKVGGDAPAGRSYQMWFVHPSFPGGPRSLGVFTDRVPDISATLAQYSPDIVNNATYAVSVEPLGGSPTGSPTGPVPYHGKLIEVDR
jgi:anti-sigma-K factor RskA